MRSEFGTRSAWLCAGVLLILAVLAPGAPWQLRAQKASGGPEQDWEKAAGGEQQFDVASVRQDQTGGPSTSNFPLDSGNAYFTIDKSYNANPEGSLFAAKNQTLLRYIVFAYKLSGTQELALRFDYYKGMESHTPDWVKSDGFDIEARAPASATKDQMRLMMQSLLAERFGLAVHWQTHETLVFALVEDKPGKLGPQIEAHGADGDCTAAPVPDQANQTAGAALQLGSLPIPCGMIAHLPANAPGAHRFGGRDVPLAMLATSLPTQTGLVVIGRPVIDETRLKGGYDFWMEWTPEDTSEVNNSESGGTFREALKNQLGLKLQPANGPVEVLVIDRVEQPTAN